MAELESAFSLYEQYVEIAKIGELPTFREIAEPEFFAPQPSPLTLVISSR